MGRLWRITADTLNDIAGIISPKLAKRKEERFRSTIASTVNLPYMIGVEVAGV